MSFKIYEPHTIHPSAVIDVREGFIAPGALIREGARIEGTRVELGREAFLDRGAMIGGGSCFDPGAYVKAGDFLHMGWNSQINIGRGVDIGDEFGCGIETKIFTHGAYIDSWTLGAPVQWAPVRIGSSVWMPNAWVNPGVTVGDDVIVAARSLVNTNLPAGCLAGGVPARVLKEKYLPRTLSAEEKRELLVQISEQAILRWRHGKSLPDDVVQNSIRHEGAVMTCHENGRSTIFHLDARTIEGAVTELARILRDQLRRNGIRFRYDDADGRFIAWPQA